MKCDFKERKAGSLLISKPGGGIWVFHIGKVSGIQCAESCVVLGIIWVVKRKYTSSRRKGEDGGGGCTKYEHELRCPRGPVSSYFPKCAHIILYYKLLIALLFNLRSDVQGAGKFRTDALPLIRRQRWNIWHSRNSCFGSYWARIIYGLDSDEGCVQTYSQNGNVGSASANCNVKEQRYFL
jgi:hypothetical protein